MQPGLINHLPFGADEALGVKKALSKRLINREGLPRRLFVVVQDILKSWQNPKLEVVAYSAVHTFAVSAARPIFNSE